MNINKDRSPKAEDRGPKTEGRRPTTENRFRISDFGLRSSVFSLQSSVLGPRSSVFSLQSSVFSLLTTVFCLLSTVVWGGFQAQAMSMGDGEGMATIAPASVGVSDMISVATITFTVGPTGISAGGGIKLDVPYGWTAPSITPGNPGFVVSMTTAPSVVLQTQVSTETTFGSGSVTVNVMLGSLAKNDIINVYYTRVISQSWTGQTYFMTSSKSSPSGSLVGMYNTPYITVGGGDPENLALTDESNGSFQAILANNISAPIIVQTTDMYGNVRPVTSNVNVTLSASQWDLNMETVDTNAQFSTDLNVFADGTTNFVVIQAGQSQVKFRYKTSAIGDWNIQANAQDYPDLGYFRMASYNVRVMAGGLSGISVDTGQLALGQTSVTITPDYDGVNDMAYINFTLPDPNMDWHILIATGAGNSFASNNLLFERWGWGVPGRSVSWEGRNWRNQNVVDSGTYTVRIELSGGGIKDESLRIAVQSLGIGGAVYNTIGAALSDVDIEAFGQNGWGRGKSDSNGLYAISGLRAGEYSLRFTKRGYATKEISEVNGRKIKTGDTVTVTLEADIEIRVAATLPAGTTIPYDLWGHVSAHSEDYSKNAFGNLHFAQGTTQSDNGFWSGDPNYSTWTFLNVEPNKTYNMETYIQGFGSSSTIIAITNQSREHVFTFDKKTNLYGWVILPSTQQYGTWISVEGTKDGNTYPTVWGGLWIDPNNMSPPPGVFLSSGVYQIYGVDPGTYTFTARAQGYASQNKTFYVGAQDIGTPENGSADDQGVSDFPAFGEGKSFSGTITIIGDTSKLMPSGEDQTKFEVFLNAWSPTNFSGGGTRVLFPIGGASPATATYQIKGLDDGAYSIWTWLQGFDVDGGMPKSVTVPDGSLNITFREFSGSVTGQVDIGANPDYSNVTVELEGMMTSTSTTLSGPSFEFRQLPTGMYKLTAAYSNGVDKRRTVQVINGQATNTGTLSLLGNTYSISGTVAINGEITIEYPMAATPYSVKISSFAGLAAGAASTDTLKVVALRVGMEGIEGLDENGRGKMNIGQGGPMPGPSCSDTPDEFTNHSASYINAGGTFTITGLTPGRYMVGVWPLIDCGRSSGGDDDPDLAGETHFISISTGSKSGIAITIQNGQTVSGTVSLPQGETGGSREIWVNLNNLNRIFRFNKRYTLSGNSASYSITHVTPGDYILNVMDPGFFAGGGSGPTSGVTSRYVGVPKRLTISQGQSITQDITLTRGAKIKGKLRDSDSGTVITTKNASQYLSGDFGIFAQANPWIEGGWVQPVFPAQGAGFGRDANGLNSEGYFTLEPVMPGVTYDISMRSGMGGGFGFAEMAQGQKSYAPVTIAGKKVDEGQILDLGVIDLKQGITMSGRVTDTNGNTLPNIRVEAEASLEHSGENHIEAFTDGSGRYQLVGIDRDKRYYDVIAAPRFDMDDDFFGFMGGLRYGEKIKEMIDVSVDANRENNDFTLELALGSLSGRVATSDNGELTIEGFGGDGMKTSGAMLFIQKEGTIPRDNPLGDIEALTEADGTFLVETLTPGNYIIRAAAFGYGMASKTVTVSTGETQAGTITLKPGATLTGTITKPDGKNPSSDEVEMALAATQDLSDVIFGSLTTNSTTRLISAYKISGLQPNTNYMALMISKESDDIIVGATNISFSTQESTATKTLNLVYQPSPPILLATFRKSGNSFQLRFESSQALRNQTSDDNNLSQILSLAGGAGALSSVSLGPDRKTLFCVYTQAQGETSFSLRVKFTSAISNPATGTNFTFDETLQYLVGLGAHRRIKLSNVTGGEVKLEGDPSKVKFQGGCFDVSTSSSLEINMLSADSQSGLTSGSSRFQSPGLGALETAKRLGPSAYPAAMYAAMQAAPQVSPLSSFYEILLPAGISRGLKKDAQLTLKYAHNDTTHPNEHTGLNIYYYNGNLNVYTIENENRTVDVENHTVTVNINHASVFVVLQNNAPVIQGATYNGDLFVYNFPNPFDLTSKTVTMTNTSGGSSQININGTMLHYGLPTSTSGRVKIEIFNLAGELVRTLDDGERTGGSHYYTEWDGKNDSGRKVASGVYVARFTVGGGNEKFFKMAVLK